MEGTWIIECDDGTRRVTVSRCGRAEPAWWEGLAVTPGAQPTAPYSNPRAAAAAAAGAAGWAVVSIVAPDAAPAPGGALAEVWAAAGGSGPTPPAAAVAGRVLGLRRASDALAQAHVGEERARDAAKAARRELRALARAHLTAEAAFRAASIAAGDPGGARTIVVRPGEVWCESGGLRELAAKWSAGEGPFTAVARAAEAKLLAGAVFARDEAGRAANATALLRVRALLDGEDPAKVGP